eukprot:c12473_g2_i2.p1 GENE.c12473_g2_i2~~c12473_g2_i2.p1  ORF type:complete len:503 (-),score=136.81 c12473_g2_i2:216-1724(-)
MDYSLLLGIHHAAMNKAEQIVENRPRRKSRISHISDRIMSFVTATRSPTLLSPDTSPPQTTTAAANSSSSPTNPNTPDCNETQCNQALEAETPATTPTNTSTESDTQRLISDPGSSLSPSSTPMTQQQQQQQREIEQLQTPVHFTLPHPRTPSTSTSTNHSTSSSIISATAAAAASAIAATNNNNNGNHKNTNNHAYYSDNNNYSDSSNNSNTPAGQRSIVSNDLRAPPQHHQPHHPHHPPKSKKSSKTTSPSSSSMEMLLGTDVNRRSASSEPMVHCLLGEDITVVHPNRRTLSSSLAVGSLLQRIYHSNSAQSRNKDKNNQHSSVSSVIAGGELHMPNDLHASLMMPAGPVDENDDWAHRHRSTSTPQKKPSRLNAHSKRMQMFSSSAPSTTNAPRPSTSHTMSVVEQAFFRVHGGGVHSEDYAITLEKDNGSIYHFGIIDVLQEWDLQKRIERFIKTSVLCQHREGVSAVSPDLYKKRFLARMREMLEISDPDLLEPEA